MRSTAPCQIATSSVRSRPGTGAVLYEYRYEYRCSGALFCVKAIDPLRRLLNDGCSAAMEGVQSNGLMAGA